MSRIYTAAGGGLWGKVGGVHATVLLIVVFLNVDVVVFM